MLTVSGLHKCEIMCLHPHPQSADTKDSLEFSAGKSATWLFGVFLGEFLREYHIYIYN